MTLSRPPEPLVCWSRLSLMRPLLRFMAVLALVAAAALGQVPVAHAACVSPIITATGGPSGQLVVTGKYFVTECNDSGDQTEQEVLGPPATDISLVVRELAIDDLGVEWQIALGDADTDYSFEVELEPPPSRP